MSRLMTCRAATYLRAAHATLPPPLLVAAAAVFALVFVDPAAALPDVSASAFLLLPSHMPLWAP